MVESTTTESSPARTSAPSPLTAAFSAQTAALKSQLRHFSSRSDVVAVLLKFVSQTFSSAATRLDFRVRERTEITLQTVPSMPKELAQKFSERWLGPLALEVQTDTDHSARSKIYERDGQAIFVASAAILDQESRIPDGAVSMLIMGRPQDGHLLTSQLDALTTVAAQRLAELAVNRFASFSDFPLRSSTPVVGGDRSSEAHAFSANPPEHLHPMHGLPLSRAAAVSETSPLLTSMASADANPHLVAEQKTGRDSIQTRSSYDEQSRGVHDLNPAAMGKIAGHGSPREFAFSIVNALANQSGAEQVAFGITSGQRIQLLAISGLTDFKPSSPGVALMTQAMEECLDFGNATVCPIPAGMDTVQLPIHRRWSVEAGAASVCSVPLSDSQGVSAVISLRRASNRPFTKDEITSLTRSLQPYGHALRMLDRATRPLPQQVRFAAKESLQRSFAAGSTGRLGLLGGLLLIGVWLVFGS